MTLNNKLEFDLPVWKKVSEPCKDLISKLLEKDPTKRVSLDNALKHKWFHGINIHSQTGFVHNKNASQNFKNKKLGL